MIRTGPWLAEAWEIFKQDAGIHIVVFLLLGIASSVSSGILYGPLLCGYYYMIFKHLQDPNSRLQLGDIAKGFDVFVHALVAWLLMAVFVNLGAIACFVGTIVVSALLVFVFPLIMDRRMDFWPAFEASFEKTKNNWLGWSLFVLVLGLVYIAGIIACFVGILVTGPLTLIATALAYRDNFGFAGEQVLDVDLGAGAPPTAPMPPAPPTPQ